MQVIPISIISSKSSGLAGGTIELSWTGFDVMICLFL